VTHLHPLISKLWGRNSLIFLAFASLLVCVFLKPKVLSQPAYNFQLTYDISQSMNVQDYIVDEKNISRLKQPPGYCKCCRVARISASVFLPVGA